MFAEKSGIDFVSNAIEIDLKDDVMEVYQETEEGYNIVSLEFPAVVTVSKPNYDPHYPTIKTKMASRKAVIPTYLAEIGEVKQAKVCFICFIGSKCCYGANEKR